jgi:hypothetical protein
MRGSWELSTSPAMLDWKRVSGGYLVQTRDAIAPDEIETGSSQGRSRRSRKRRICYSPGAPWSMCGPTRSCWPKTSRWWG